VVISRIPVGPSFLMTLDLLLAQEEEIQSRMKQHNDKGTKEN
jgi:hypothetical protein